MAINLDVIDVPREELEKRIARFDKLKYNPNRYPDNKRDGNDKKIFTVVGPGLQLNNAGDAMPAIPVEEGFNMTFVKTKPGSGPALHVHDGNETFIAVSGRWKVISGTNEQEEFFLEPFDVISMPAFVPRRFVNVTEGEDDAEHMLIAVLAGSHPKAMFVEPDLN